MEKKLDKITATYRFKVDILSLAANQKMTELQKRDLWDDYMLTLASLKQISYAQASKWVYPAKELK
jgi:hypothetical protein